MRITSKGQVTIPIEIRQKLGLQPNTEVEFEVTDDSVRIRKVRGHRRGDAVIGHLRGRGSVSMTTEQIMTFTRSEH